MEYTDFSRPKEAAKDRIATALTGLSQNIFLVVFGLLPLFFVPVFYAPFEYSKILVVIIGVLVATIFFGLSVLRSGSFQLPSSMSFLAFWLIPVVALVSALLSGDVKDAMVGDTVTTQSAVFLVLMAFVITAVTAILNHKRVIMRFYLLIMGSAMVLGLFHVVRLLLGPEALTFGTFGSLVSSPLGGWNDLGLFFGLTIILSLVALEQIPLTKWGRILVSGIVVLSLLILAVVNFLYVWVVLGVVSLIMLIYGISKDRFGINAFALEQKQTSTTSIVIAAAVFIVSFVFIIGGTAVGTLVSNVSGVSYIEVRPSIAATADIARNVYSENALLGIGPNKFVDAWRLYKDDTINQTIFWSTDFLAGNGFVTTLFVTTGILGVVSWLLFFGMYLRTGFKMLFRSQVTDRLVFFIATSSFIASVYLWGMSFVYVPSAVMLLLAALFTGIVFAMYGTLIPNATRTFAFGSDRRTGFILVSAVMLIIVGSVSAMYVVGRHYAASYMFAKTIATITDGTTLESVEQNISAAYTLAQSDIFARQVASYQIARINGLLALPEPTPEQQAQFQNALVNGVNAGRLAVEADRSDSLNWATLGAVYSLASLVPGEEAFNLGKEAFREARARDPKNPSLILAEAQLESRNGNIETARALTEEAVRMRPQYTDAVFFLSQLEVAAGNLDGAIESTIASIRLEPQNASRYYQLGVLYASKTEVDNAILAFEEAVRIDPSFANARYFLALAYVEKNRPEDAIAQLTVVAELNPDNAELPQLIARIRSGEVINVPAAGESVPVAEPNGVNANGEEVSTNETSDTPLVTPVNPGVPSPEAANTPAPQQ